MIMYKDKHSKHTLYNKRRFQIKECDFKDIKKLRLHLNRIKRQKDFLKDCKYFKITPKFLRVSNKFIWDNFRKELIRFESIIINKLIRKKFSEMATLERSIVETEKELRTAYDRETLENEFNKIEHFAKLEDKRETDRQRRKLKFWIKRDNQRPGIIKEKPREIPFLNLSSLTLNSHEKALLNKGPKYIIEDKIDIEDAIPKIECMLESIPMAERGLWRGEIQSDIMKKLKERDRNFEDRKVLAKLKNKREFVFAHTDKTGKIAILDRENYNEKMKETIGEINAEKIKKDPCDRLTKKVKELLKEGTWPDGKNPKIELIAANTPRIFGRVKDHKTPIKLRPIVNKREGPTYELEKYMKEIYENCGGENKYEIKSSNEFMEKLRNIVFEEGDLMVSFDVCNLYPSIDITEMNTKLNELIANKYNKYGRKTVETLIRTNNLLLNENYFSFNNEIFKQKNGVPMGSPISGIIASIKMRELDEKINNEFKHRIKAWIRYVDDIFAVIKGGDPEGILKNINEMDRNIKFTKEEAVNNRLNFLDITIMKDGNHVETTVYRKPTANNEIISAKCKTPYNYKIAALRSYINRAINICSSDQLIKEELKQIKQIAKNAGYKEEIIDKLYRKRLEKLENIESGQRPKKKFTRPIPYLKGLSNKISKTAKRKNVIVPIRQNPSIFQRIRNEREKINELETAGIYRINMKDEEGDDKVYIGVTSRKIKERIKEHMSDIKYERCGTALAQRNRVEKLEIDFKNVKKIANFENKNYAFKREAVEIIKEAKSINYMEHSQIDAQWRRILERKRTDQSRKEEERKRGRGEIHTNTSGSSETAEEDSEISSRVEMHSETSTADTS